MSLDKAAELIGSLLIPQTYTDLQRAEEVLQEQGICISDDFVWTDERKQVLSAVEKQFRDMIAPTVILTGWFGSGKTALLSRIVRDFDDERLRYGGRKLDTILIQLNVQNTLSLFLDRILASVADLKDTGWVLERYRKARAFIDLPDVIPTDIRNLVETLMQMPAIRMAEVAQFLDEIFEQYKRSTDGKRILALVIDELENLTRKSKLEGTDKLVELLKILIDNAVREYMDRLAVVRNPRAIVIFSITSRRDLAGAQWFPQDTLERMAAVEQDVNLSLQTAEFLMKRILRIYFTSIVPALLKESTDARLQNWNNQLRSASRIEDTNYTFPVVPEVHRFFVSRLLKPTPDGQVLAFRAYQTGIYKLLNSWQGEGPIGLPFMVKLYEALAHELEQYPGGIILDNLIGEEQVRSLVERRLPRLRGGAKFLLGTITHLAITHGTTPLVSITRRKLQEWLSEEDAPSEAAFRELLDAVKRMDLDEWSVTGDTIHVNVKSIVVQLSEHVEPVSVQERAEELAKDTQPERAQKPLPRLFGDWLDSQTLIKASCDELGMLHVADNSPKGQLIGTSFLAFDADEESVRKLVDNRTALCPGILFREAEQEAENGLPFEVSVLLPVPLRDRGDFYANKIRDRFQQWWDDSFYPLISAIVRLEHCSDYDAFREALKVMLLLKDQSRSEREAFRAFEKDLRRIILDMDLTDTDKEGWISAKLCLVSFHSIDPTRRLIKVLSWQEGEEESILYNNSDGVKPSLHARFNVNLPHPEEWKREVIEEWEVEDFISDGRLVPSSKWSENRRDLYSKVNDRLREQPLSFYEVGKTVFGETHIDNLPRAKVAVHLFLKLGKASPWNWVLTDDRHRYKDMQISSGELRQKQLVKQIRQKLELTLRDLVLAFYVASNTKREQRLEKIKKVLRVRAQLTEATSVPTLQTWDQEITTLAPSRPTKHYMEEELIQKCPPHVSKQAEYLEKLKRLLQGDSSLAYAVSQRAPDFVEQISIDIECERLFKRIEKLHKNWGEEVPFKLDKDRFLINLYSEYTLGLGETTNWEGQKAKQCDSKFSEKVSNLAREGLEDKLQSICTWLDMRAEEIISPEWKATYDEDERARLEQLLKDSLEKTTQEISEIRNDLNSQIETLDRFESDPLLASYARKIREYRLRLGQNYTSLSQIEGRLEEVQFGSMLADIRDRLDQWNQLKAEIVQSKTSTVDTWLEQHPRLVPLRDRILENLSNATMRLDKITRQMMKAGSDPVEQLLKGEVEDVLALFAAVQLLEALEKGEV